MTEYVIALINRFSTKDYYPQKLYTISSYTNFYNHNLFVNLTTKTTKSLKMLIIVFLKSSCLILLNSGI